MHVAVPPVDVSALTAGASGESSRAVRERVAAARELQRARQARGETSVATNAELGARDLERVAALGKDARRLIEAAVTQLGLSARAFVKVLRVARTLADLDEAPRVRAPHVAEAIQGRLLDREATS